MERHSALWRTALQATLHGWGQSLIIAGCLAIAVLVGLHYIEKSSYEEFGLGECPTDDLAYSLNLIAPAQLGVEQWEVGDYAEYRYRRKLVTLTSVAEQYFSPSEMKSRMSARNVKYHIVGELDKLGKKRHWIKVTGLEFIRTIPRESYQLVTPADMRITSENPRYDYVKDYVPSQFNLCHQNSMPLARLTKLGEVELETAAGRFECNHYRVEFGSGSDPIEIWTNPNVLPSGIVKVSTPNEVLELISYGCDIEYDIPKFIEPVITGISTLGEGCTSCHGYDNCHESIYPPR